MSKTDNRLMTFLKPSDKNLDIAKFSENITNQNVLDFGNVNAMVVRISNDNKYWIIGLSNGTIVLLSTEESEKQTNNFYTLNADGETLPCSDLQPIPELNGRIQDNCHLILAVYVSGHARLWHYTGAMKSSRLLATITEERISNPSDAPLRTNAENMMNQILSCSCSYDGKRFVTGGVDCHLRVYDMKSRKRLQICSSRFSEWIELHQTGQLGLRLINTLQSLSIINFTNYIQIILNHLPLLIISIPYGFIIPLFNCILDKGFLLLSSSSQVIHRKDDSMMKQNDNLSVSSSTWIMNISTLCILSIAWLVTESLAVLLLSLLLLINNITFNQQNSINNDNYQLLNIQKEIQKKSIKLINNQYQIKLYYYLYLIKYRIFIILIIISIYMLNDWILFIENIKFIDYSNSSLFLHYSSNLQFNHTISSTFILLCTSIWLLQFGIIHIQSPSASSSQSPPSSSSSPSSLFLLYNYHHHNMYINSSNDHLFYKFLIILCKLILIYLLLNIFNLVISLYQIIQFTTFCIECISLLIWLSCKI